MLNNIPCYSTITKLWNNKFNYEKHWISLNKIKYRKPLFPHTILNFHPTKHNIVNVMDRYNHIKENKTFLWRIQRSKSVIKEERALNDNQKYVDILRNFSYQRVNSTNKIWGVSNFTSGTSSPNNKASCNFNVNNIKALQYPSISQSMSQTMRLGSKLNGYNTLNSNGHSTGRIGKSKSWNVKWMGSLTAKSNMKKIIY